MRLFNIGAEGQLYFGAIGAAGIALLLAGQSAVVIVPAMIVAGAACGAAWGAIPGVLRAFAHTNEIITSLMLNYVAALVLNYLIFDSLSYWRDTSATGQLFPQGKPLPDAAAWPTFTLGSVVGAVRLRRRDPRRGGRVGALRADAVRLRGAGDRRLAPGRALRRHAHQAEDRRRPLPVGRDRRASAGRARTGTSATCSTRAASSRRTTGTPASSSRRSPATTRSRSILVAFLLGGLENAGYTLQGADFPSGLVGMMQGIILFAMLGGELLVRYRIVIERPTGRRPRRSARRRDERRHRRRRARGGGRLRDAAPLRRARRAARGAVGGAQPRRRGDDADGRGDRLPLRPARRRALRASRSPSRSVPPRWRAQQPRRSSRSS